MLKKREGFISMIIAADLPERILYGVQYNVSEGELQPSRIYMYSSSP